MTLFARAAPKEPLFNQALERFSVDAKIRSGWGGANFNRRCYYRPLASMRNP